MLVAFEMVISIKGCTYFKAMLHYAQLSTLQVKQLPSCTHLSTRQHPCSHLCTRLVVIEKQSEVRCLQGMVKLELKYINVI